MRQDNPSAGQSSFNVQEFIDRRPMALPQWWMLSICFVILMVDGAQTSATGFVAPALSKDLSISRLALGPVFSSALIGLALGALIAGPMADRIGRKRVLIGSVIMFGCWSLATAFTHSLTSLLFFRFMTGIGVGAAMPNCTTLASEYVPARRRSLLLNLMFCGFPLGAALGGFIAAWLIATYGWRSVFVIGGSGPFVLVVLLFLIPESIAFMTAHGWPPEKIRAALLWVAAGDANEILKIKNARSFLAHATPPGQARSPLRIILAEESRTGTLMLWLAYFMGLLIYFLLTSWTPLLLQEAGSSTSTAAFIGALFPLGGGIGALVCGWLMDRMNPDRVVSAAYLASALLLLVLAYSTRSIRPLMIMMFLAGLAMNGAQTSMPVLAAMFYPTKGRASGVAWMLGIGRFGGVLGALIGGVLLNIGLTMSLIVDGLAIVSMIAAGALLLKDLASRGAGIRTKAHDQ